MNSRVELDINDIFMFDEDETEDVENNDTDYSFKLELDTSIDFNFSLDDEIIIDEVETCNNLGNFKKDFMENVDKNDIKCYNNNINDKGSKKKTKRDTGKGLNMLRINTGVIKKAYKLNNLNQKDLAELLNISERSVNRKLNSETDFTAVELLKLIDLLNIDTKELLN